MMSDDLMSDPVNPAEGPSASDGRQAAKGAAAAAWNTNKFRDEYLAAKNKLLDQKFSVSEYPDPLSPRPPHPKQYPPGTDRQLERKLQELVAQVRSSAGHGVVGSA
ncbi:hypothetical protein VTJ83DRAFT_632 [Remersonia thermophila]|uniref:Uncharacterized protein n=1 Tax=Remersonia thermophila TaxID=72144 RepID=A0ABR4DLI5_9PEZI